MKAMIRNQRVTGGNLQVIGKGFVFSVAMNPPFSYCSPRREGEFLDSVEIAAWKEDNADLSRETLNELLALSGVEEKAEHDDVMGYVEWPIVVKVLAFLAS